VTIESLGNDFPVSNGSAPVEQPLSWHKKAPRSAPSERPKSSHLPWSDHNFSGSLFRQSTNKKILTEEVEDVLGWVSSLEDQ
jgi:hypothetical protein